MIEKEFDAITKTDIDALVTNAASEGRSTEYKAMLPEGADEDTREFLADISSFANAGGGDLIYGIREQRDDKGKPSGVPEAAEGLAGINVDMEINRLESKIRDGIDPRIPTIRVKPIDGFPSGPVIIFRIPKSWSSPHMVKFRNSSRFFSRTSAGKYQLDVREIRASFLASESLTDKISAFRADRLGKILAGETPVPLESVPKLVLHLLPVSAFSEPGNIDLKAAEPFMHKLKPMGQPTQWGPPRYNFNGLSHSGGNGISTFSYIQLFRNGALEAVSARIAQNKLALGNRFEGDLLGARPYIDFQKRLGIGPPLFLAISILSATGFTVFPREPTGFDHSINMKPIEQDALIVPEAMIQDEEPDILRLIRPALDAIWQASGWPGSPGYDASGKWVGYLHWHG